MDQKAFDLIVNRLDTVLKEQGFQKQKGFVDEVEGKSVFFLGEHSAYSVLYNEQEMRFELRSTDMTDEGPDTDKWKSISNWLYNPETDTIKDAESIANDFTETLQGDDRRAALRAARRKPQKDKDNNPGPVFFYKRLVQVFPELKDEVAEELAAYEQFRAVTFAKTYVVPKIEAQAKKKDAADTKKLCSLLDDFYKNGDFDVRSIISMVIFNGISEEGRKNLLEHMSPEFQKYYHKAAVRYINKKVKPEKEKRQRASRDLSGGDAPQRLSGKIPKSK